MKFAYAFMFAAAAALATVPADAEAQQRGRGKPPVEREQDRRAGEDDRWWDRDEDRGERDDDRRRGEWDRDDRNRRGVAARGDKGPPFCRNGQGHPVHGRQWCRDKGFGTSGARWERATWEDVVFGRPSRRDTRGELDRRTLGDILGDVVFGRLDAQRRAYGIDDALRGQWGSTNGVRYLEVAAGSVPLARLHDRDGDGRVDLVLLNRR